MRLALQYKRGGLAGRYSPQAKGPGSQPRVALNESSASWYRPRYLSRRYGMHCGVLVTPSEVLKPAVKGGQSLTVSAIEMAWAVKGGQSLPGGGIEMAWAVIIEHLAECQATSRRWYGQ